MDRWHRLLDLLLPPRCGSCREPGGWLCPACAGSIHRLAEPLCRRCGRELAFAGESCGCRARLRSLSSVRALGVYEGALERAIHRFKYEGWRCLAPRLASLLLEVVPEPRPHPALVLAVPLHPARERRRGYNQSELLARRVSRELQPAHPPGRLVRTRATPPQVGLDRVRRRENVRGAFAWKGRPLAGQPVLLLDDVTTTGATLEACAGVLREAGSGAVTGLTLAWVRL